jgi:glycosyltransferase involved in cell wall biosynthesis
MTTTPDGAVLYVLDYMQTFIRGEMAELARRGRTVRVTNVTGSGLWDCITGSELPPGVEKSFEARSAWYRVPGPLLPLEMALRLRKIILKNPGRFFALARESMRLSSLRQFLIAAELACQLSEDPPARIQGHFAWGASLIGMFAARLLAIPFSVTVHARDIFVAPSAETVDVLLKASSPPISISRFNLSVIASRWGAEAASRVAVVHLGIDPGSLPAPREPEQPQIIFSTASGLVEKKGANILLEACEILSRRRSGWRCVVAGSDEKGEVLERYRALVKRKGLQGRVEFPGAVRASDLLEMAASASVFALPCIEAADGDMDGIPVSLMEAMAMGLPVVSTRISGIPELIEDGVSGILTSPGDAEALARALEGLLDDRSRAMRMGGAGRDRILAGFTLAGHVDALERAWAEGAPDPVPPGQGADPE